MRARPSVFNDISRDNDLTLISVFKQPHLVSFRIIESKVRPEKYWKFKFHELFQHWAKKTRLKYAISLKKGSTTPGRSLRQHSMRAKSQTSQTQLATKEPLKYAEIQVQLKHWKPSELGTEGYPKGPMGSCCYSSRTKGWVQWMDTVWNHPQGPEKFLRPIEIESVTVVTLHWPESVCAVCQVHLSCHVDTVICQLHQLHNYCHCTTFPRLRFADHDRVKTSPNSCCVENPRSVGARTR
jgi:hypothetical protein